MIHKKLVNREQSFNREGLLRLFASEVYGEIPLSPIKTDFEEKMLEGANFCAGHAQLYEINLNCKLRDGKFFSFPFKLCVPRSEGRHKAVILLNFRYGVPDKYCPAEEIIDNGWAFAVLDYQKITSDSPLADGLAEIYSPNGETGKLSLWAWAAMRIMDHFQARDDIDIENVGVVGHSRLGKTALWAVANDERFRFVHSNDSGTSGAALYKERNEKSESIKDICETFPYWFNKTFPNYAEKESDMGFDQNMLLACIAPRVLSVGSASEDLWANPRAEMLSAKKSSEAWERYGEKGLVGISDEAEIGVNYHDGRVGYYVRKGRHYLSRDDWKRFLSFFEKNLNP